MLSNIIPGFRDVRAPAIAGYLWLVCAWLIVTPELTDRPPNAVTGSLWDLVQLIGRPATFVAVSVVAYLFGALWQDLVREALRRWRHRQWEKDPFWAGQRDSMGPKPGSRAAPERLRDWVALRGLNERGEALGKQFRDASGDDRRAGLRELVDIHGARARAVGALEAELRDQPALLLLGRHPEVFAEVDRHRAEAELRLAIAAPLAVLAAIATVKGHWAAIIALVAVVALWVQGQDRAAQALDLMDRAIARDPTIESAALRQYRADLDEIEARGYDED